MTVLLQTSLVYFFNPKGIPMKKTLIALAAVAATGAAMAQSSVTLYGIVDVNLQSSKTTGGVRLNSMADGGVSGSRFGLKGAEDLGGGLKAIFVLENGFTVDTGANAKAGSIFNRQSYVGLTGGFGEVRLGNTTTAYDDISIAANPLWDSILSPANTVWANNYVSRPGNTIYYASPSFAGVTGAASYSLGENKTATTPAKGVTSVNVQYAGGPVAVSLGYQESQMATLAAASAAAHKDTLLNASYDLGVVKLLGSYNRHEATDKTKSDQYQFGVDVPVSPALVLSTGYAYSKAKLNGVSGSKDQGFGLGAKYSLSKRTFVYTGINHTEDKTAAGVTTKTDLYAVGIQHAF
jgi:predicted porin